MVRAGSRSLAEDGPGAALPKTPDGLFLNGEFKLRRKRPLARQTVIPEKGSSQ